MTMNITEQFLNKSAFNAMKRNNIHNCYEELQSLLALINVRTDTGKLISCVNNSKLEIGVGKYFHGEWVYAEVTDIERKRYATIRLKRAAGDTSLVLRLHTKSGNPVGRQMKMIIENDPLNRNDRIYGHTASNLFELMSIYFDTGKKISDDVLKSTSFINRC